MIKKDAIVTKILTLIQTGILSPGDKLPSLRQIAADNRVSLYTAIGAYEELVAMGVIENVPKVGSFVLDCGGNVEKLLKMRNSALPIRQELEAPENVRIYERYSENLQIARETEST
ncbi:MAG: winged helix-turn-helix transcriptional regulator [Oscillospiraceae bacterium]|nr:winged helix-turn-helix transcriptional regulator [Oscillospiraceae bacterium]